MVEMNKEHEFRLEPGTWVAQDASGLWYAYKYEPLPDRTVFLGCLLRLLVYGGVNPHWRDTPHQIQPGEVIYLSEGE